MKSIDKAVEASAHTMRSVLKRNSMRFAAVLLTVLAISVAVPNAALAAAPQHHDQVPGFYRLQVGDLEVTALFDGPAVFHQQWLTGTKASKATMDGVVEALQKDPHMLEAADTGFLVNTGKQLILVDAGSGAWFGGGRLGRLAGSLRSAGYTPEEVDLVLITHLHSDHIGGLTTQDGTRVFPNADVYVAKAESDFWLSPEIAAKAPKDVQPFFQSAQAIAAPYIKAGKWHTFSGSETIVDGMQLVPLAGHTPGHTGYEFSSQGQKILFWGDTIHAQRVQLPHPEVTVVFDIDPAAAAATRNQLLSKLAREDVVIAGPHMLFPSLGRLHKEGSGYSWAPVQFTYMAESKEARNKALVLKAFDTLFNKRDYTEAERYWSPDYIQHSAHIAPGRQGLFSLIKGIPPTLKYEPGVIAADGDFVIVHGLFSGFGSPVNWIAADIVRIKDGLLVEHWDVIQDEATREQSQSGNPMFGNTFPDTHAHD